MQEKKYWLLLYIAIVLQCKMYMCTFKHKAKSEDVFVYFSIKDICYVWFDCAG